MSSSGDIALPAPTITYHIRGRPDFNPRGVIGEGSPLFSVNEVIIARNPDGQVKAYISGPMRKRDGGMGRHSRCLVARPNPDQPMWLAMLFADALARLNRPEKSDH